MVAFENRFFCGLLLWLWLLSPAAGASPRAWELSATSPESYLARQDREVFHGGRGSGCLKSVGPVTPRSFAVLLQKIDGQAFQGRRVRMSGYIRTVNVTGWAGMWMRVDPRVGPALEFDNMQNRPISGTTPWTRYSIELNVPPEGDSIHFGALLTGAGEVWLDDVTFEKLGVALPASKERQKLRKLPIDPSNLDFED